MLVDGEGGESPSDRDRHGQKAGRQAARPGQAVEQEQLGRQGQAAGCAGALAVPHRLELYSRRSGGREWSRCPREVSPGTGRIRILTYNVLLGGERREERIAGVLAAIRTL